jgi:hypothetical protein
MIDNPIMPPLSLSKNIIFHTLVHHASVSKFTRTPKNKEKKSMQPGGGGG